MKASEAFVSFIGVAIHVEIAEYLVPIALLCILLDVG
jgi:hypothetical protein